MRSEARLEWDARRPGGHQFDTACVAPWVSLEFDPAGLVYGCCSSQLYPLGRIGEDRLSEIWNGARTGVLRDALRKWDLTVACGSCRWHLEHGRTDPVAAVYDRYPALEEPDVPHMMLFALSNRCNLACVMCNGELSSRIRAEEGRPPLESPYDDEFFEDLHPLITRLELAKFLGGEPFLVPEHFRVWDLLGQLSKPPRLDITTNGTVWTSGVESVLDRFDADISISVDAATADTYKRVRGGDFARLRTNLTRFRSEVLRRKNRFHMSYCLMAQNWDELFAFLEWAEELSTLASVNLVVDEGMALHDLPEEQLRAVLRSWRTLPAEALELNRDVWETQVRQLESVIRERSVGHLGQPRRSGEVPPGFFSQHPEAAIDASELQVQREDLQRWSQGSGIAELNLDSRGTVCSVLSELPGLGLSRQLLQDEPVGALPRILGRSPGSNIWVVDYEESPSIVRRTLVISAERPDRGSNGTVIRLIEVGQTSGTTILIAADHFFEAPVTVRPPSRRLSGS